MVDSFLVENKCNWYLYAPYLSSCRNDDKSALEYNIEGGSVLHLVLALRGGQ